MPWANTIHGLTPDPAAIRIDSPNPNNRRPRTKYTNVITLGQRISGFVELHDKNGTVLMDKKESLKIIFVSFH